ncbi:MAG TPA: phosphatase PAP2 family protein [Thermomicrobiales bacterium]|nr:phosphatase PAP2 family protein [Thermomicrobiales bacterium]
MSLRAFVNTPRSTMINPERIAKRQSKRGLIYAVVAMVTFSAVFTLVRTKRSQPTDTAITLNVQKKDHPVFDRLMRLVSWPGFPPQSRLLPPGIAAALWLRGMRLEAVFQLAAWGTGGISTVFKRIMQRPRPSSEGTGIKVAVANIGGTSFPSGHVIIYTGVYGFLTFLAHTWIRPAAIRRAVVGLLGGMLSLVGLSRIYLGHHWFTDVVASYLLGTTYLLGLISVYRRVKRWSLRG